MVFLCLFYCSIWSTTPKLCLYMVFILKSKRPRTTLVLNTRFIFRSVLAFFRKALKLFLHFLIKLAKLFTWETKSFVCFVLPAFLDTARLPRGNRHEWDSQVPCKVPWLVGLARRVIHPVESPFFDGRVTLLAGQTFRLFAFSPFRKHFGTLSRVNSVKARQSEYARALS